MSSTATSEPPDLWDRYLDAPFKGRVRGFNGWVLDLRILTIPPSLLLRADEVIQ